jgi:hypothetical protein
VVKLILCVHVMPSINICKVGSQWRLWARTDELQACGLLSHAHLHTGFRVVELLGQGKVPTGRHSMQCSHRFSRTASKVARWWGAHKGPIVTHLQPQR